MKLSCIEIDKFGTRATFRGKTNRCTTWKNAGVPEHYTLPDWLQERVAVLSILPINNLTGYAEVDGIGHVKEVDRWKNEPTRKRYTIFVPDEHADMWGELIDEA